MSASGWYECSSCLQCFDNEQAIKQHCSNSFHEPHECYYCLQLLVDDIALATHYNIAHPHADPQDLESDSESDGPITPVTPRFSKVDVEVQTAPEQPKKTQKSIQTLNVVTDQSMLPQGFNESSSDAVHGPSPKSSPPDYTSATKLKGAYETLCFQCHCIFPSTQELHQHLISNYMWCPFCPRIPYEGKKALRKHLQSQHAKRAPLTCCGSRIDASIFTYSYHVTGRKHKAWWCRFCLLDLKTEESLKKHLKSSHQNGEMSNEAKKLYIRERPSTNMEPKASKSSNSKQSPTGAGATGLMVLGNVFRLL